MQADADGKEAKWADIDDDEDDWAPDTIEWNDGTKITLSHNDPAAALAEEQAAAAAEKRKQEEQNRARMPPPKPTTSVGPNAKVLKLGASGQPKQVGGGSALKPSSDKPTLVAKPTPPPPVKSPWASLPPVDKVTPVVINPPLQSSVPRFQQMESPANEIIPAPAPPAAAMEIAADSFTRTPRENQGGAQGQLYNSQSGQYETVTSGRRGSVRKEQNFRPPAVLQRPSHNDQRPAEPSAAFQSQRSGSQQESSRWDRRTSSTVSGGSGLQGRRGSTSRAVGDSNPSQADSQPLQSPLTPGMAQAHLRQDAISQPHAQQPLQSPAFSKVQQLSEIDSVAPSPRQGQASVQDGAAPSHTAINISAETERQKKLMKEARESAIKRKKDEEEREEAAKKERIRIKMEQLGLPPLEKPGSEKKSNEVKQVVKREATQEAQKPVKPQDEVTQAPASPPKPPMPDNTGGTRQYGVMKLHGPSLTNGTTTADRSTEVAQNAIAPTQQTLPVKSEPSSHGEERISPPLVNGDTNKPPREVTVPGSPDSREQPVLLPQRQRPWNNVPRDPNAFTAWNGSGMTTHTAPTGNLWGPPSNHKALGNGVFDGNVPRPASRHATYEDQHAQPTPQPIGPPRSSQRPRESPDFNRVHHTKSSPLRETTQTMPAYPSQEGIPAPFVREANGLGQRSLAPSETAVSMPPKPQISPERIPLDPGQQESKLAAWGNFQSTSAKEDADKRRQAAQEHAARLAEEARTGIRYEAQLPVLNETWRQVKVDDEAGQRRLVGVAKGAIIPDASPMQQVSGDVRMAPYANSPQLGHSVGAGRGSRFFPTSGQGYHNQQRAATYTVGYNRSPSPPPPDSVHHPAYARSQAHPLVNLPITKPKPTVRLPPALNTAPPTPVMADILAVPLRAVSQPLVQNPSWQDRFDGLLGVKKSSVSPEKKFAEVAGFSETKLPLENPPVLVSASVSLPSGDLDITKAESNVSVASIAVEDEEALFEEREFGSLPTVLLPTAAPKIKAQKHRKGPIRPFKEPRPVQDAMSRAIFEFSLEDKLHDDPNGFALFINLKGMPFPKKKIMPRASMATTSHNPRVNRTFSSTGKGGRGPKPRDLTGNHGNGNQKPVQSGPPRVPTQQSGNNSHGKGVWTKNWTKVPTAG